MQSAPQPSSEAAAEAAVKSYFEQILFDPGAAQYRFTKQPVNGWVGDVLGDLREFGWFMCGEVNGKNRMGGYVGYEPFFVHFSPTIPDKVDNGRIADSATAGQINKMCGILYGNG